MGDGHQTEAVDGVRRVEWDGEVYTSAGVRAHWLTASTGASPERVLGVLERFGDESAGPVKVGGFGHPWHYLTFGGVKVYTGSERSEARTVVVWDGEACDRWAVQAGYFADISADLEADGFNATRFDLAGDVVGPSLVERVRDEFKSGRYEGRIRRESIDWRETDRPPAGRTCYIGSRASSIMLRCYDYRGPTRFEFELKQERAAVAFALYAGGHPAAAWLSAVRAFGEFPKAWWWPLVRTVGEGHAVDMSRGLTSLMAAVASFRQQLGRRLAMLMLCGIRPTDLMLDLDDLGARDRRQLRMFVDDAREEGLHVSKRADSLAAGPGIIAGQGLSAEEAGRGVGEQFAAARRGRVGV